MHTRPEPRTSATHIVDQETLKASLVVHPFPLAVQDMVKDLLSVGVESACEMSAASFFPEVGCSGEGRSHVRARVHTINNRSSRSTKTARGTCPPAPVPEERLLSTPSPPPMVSSLGFLAVRLCATSETRRGHLILHQVLHRDGGVFSVRR